ncbi:MAG: phosphohistidine phosphatase SixA [Cyanobacteria bacterium K_DeepCast_35m_m2_023]|nr:phosphohistidine phosphatase SixA [Cyanobacteria bacterium K_DeepCast_35m_m2_023]
MALAPESSCELLLLRHGIAEDADPDRPPEQADAARPLSPAGRRRTAAVVQRLVQRQLSCDRLFSSPLLRAAQTAELAVAAQLAPSIELADPLAPGGQALPWLKEFADRDQLTGQRLALVGHEPDLSALAAALIGAPPGSLQLKKAGVLLLQWWPARPSARLLLVLTPKLTLP